MDSEKQKLWLTTILTDSEVRFLARRMKAMLGPEFRALSRSATWSIEDTIRIGPLARRCRLGREAKGLTISQAAAGLKVPQYRLKAIEESRFTEIRPDVLEAYVGFLGLQDWVRVWCAANPGLTRRLGLSRMATSPEQETPAVRPRSRQATKKSPAGR